MREEIGQESRPQTANAQKEMCLQGGFYSAGQRRERRQVCFVTSVRMGLRAVPGSPVPSSSGGLVKGAAKCDLDTVVAAALHEAGFLHGLMDHSPVSS